jgi:hypothetical protein
MHAESDAYLKISIVRLNSLPPPRLTVFVLSFLRCVIWFSGDQGKSGRGVGVAMVNHCPNAGLRGSPGTEVTVNRRRADVEGFGNIRHGVAP